MTQNNHSQLTGRNIHEFAAQAFSETYGNATIDAEALGRFWTWEQTSDKDRTAYERMAQLLNERIKQPTCWVATGRIGETTPFPVILATSELGESDALEQALDAIYESSLDDITKDDLRNTLSVGKE